MVRSGFIGIFRLSDTNMWKIYKVKVKHPMYTYLPWVCTCKNCDRINALCKQIVKVEGEVI